MCRAVSSVLVLLLAGVLAPSQVRGCSCPENSFGTSRTDAIIRDFASSYSPNIYTGMVIAATCNCIPGNEATPIDVTSSSLNCQHFRLESSQGIINATLLSRGECELEQYHSEELTPVCSILGNRLVTWGLMVEGPVPPASGEELPVNDLTEDSRCVFACPFNRDATDQSYSVQPCIYTVRVKEVFKGNYSENEEIEVAGPDVLTSCGNPGQRLQVSSQYVVGIGGGCGPISEWTLLSTYSPEEFELLRTLSSGLPTGGVAATASCRGGLLLFLSLLALWLSLIPPGPP